MRLKGQIFWVRRTSLSIKSCRINEDIGSFISKESSSQVSSSLFQAWASRLCGMGNMTKCENSKVRQNRNYFFKTTFPPKNEQTNSILLLWDLFSFVFLRKLKTQKRHFKINWPLVIDCLIQHGDLIILTWICVIVLHRPLQSTNRVMLSRIIFRW